MYSYIYCITALVAENSSVVEWSEFLATVAGVSGSIPGGATFSE
jgi:hypothetical protein